jgi:hypothetical protein
LSQYLLRVITGLIEHSATILTCMWCDLRFVSSLPGEILLETQTLIKAVYGIATMIVGD